MTRLAQQYIEARDIKDGSDSELESEAGEACNQPISAEHKNHIPENQSPYPRRRQCYICSRWNHVAKDCYYREFPSHSIMHHNDSMHNQNQQEQAEHKESNEHHNQQLGLSVIEVNERQGEPAAKHANETFVQERLINKKKVKVLRDTGCTTAAVKTSLVLDHQFTGKETSCTLIDGTQRRFPLARIHVDTTYYTGEVEVMVMNDPMYELILGNSTAVRKVPDPEWRMDRGWGGIPKKEIQAKTNTGQKQKTEQLQKVLCKQKWCYKDLEIIERLKYEQVSSAESKGRGKLQVPCGSN